MTYNEMQQIVEPHLEAMARLMEEVEHSQAARDEYKRHGAEVLEAMHKFLLAQAGKDPDDQMAARLLAKNDLLREKLAALPD